MYLKKISFSLILSLLIYSGVKSQNNIQRSDPSKQSAKTGIADEILGVNTKHIYIKKQAWRTHQNTTIESFNRETLEKEGQAILDNKFFKTSFLTFKRKNELGIFDKIITDKGMTLFFISKNKKEKKMEIYAVSYDEDLNKKSSLKRIYAYGYEKSSMTGKISIANSLDESGKTNNNNFAICIELPGKKGTDLEVEYKLFDADFKTVNSGKVSLNITKSSDGGGSTKFFLGANNNITMINYVRVDEEQEEKDKKEKPKLKLKEKIANVFNPLAAHYVVEINTIETANNSVKNNVLDLKKMVLKSARFVAAGHNLIKFMGFYSDVTKDKHGNNLHGIYSGLFNTESHEWEFSKFTDFDSGIINRIAQENQNTTKKSKKKDKESDRINSDIEIKYFYTEPDGSTLIVSNYEHNYSYTYTTTNGKTVQYHRMYVSDRGNISLFKVKLNGDLDWFSNVRRAASYSSSDNPSAWYIRDLNFVKGARGYNITYENTKDFETGSSKKGAKEKKSERSYLDYATLNAKTGDVMLNKYDTKSAGMFFNSSELCSVGNELYVLKSRAKIPFWYYPAVCIPSMVCFPVLIGFSPYLAPRKGEYSLARIVLDN